MQYHQPRRLTPTQAETALALYAPINNNALVSKERDSIMANIAKTISFEDAIKAVKSGKAETVVNDDGFTAWDRIGDSVTGVYVGREAIDIQGRDTWLYEFEPLAGDSFEGMFDANGETVTRKFHGTTKLDQLMNNLDYGAVLHVVYKADVTTKAGFRMKDFDVLVIPS